MILVEKHIVKKSDLFFDELDHLCFLSKNLYNYTLYVIRQHYFKTLKYLNKFQIINDFTHNKLHDYVLLPRQVSLQVIGQVDKNFLSFFSLLKKKKQGKYDKPVKLPKYRDKVKGRNILIFTNQVISRKNLRNGIISFGNNILCKIKTELREVLQVRIVHKKYYIVIEVLYNVDIKQKEDNGKYMSIDLGIDNLMTCIDNQEFKGYIINGKPLKSINHFYNKKLSHYKSKRDTKNKEAYKAKIEKLSLKRNNKINDYLHKASRCIANHLVSKNINTLIIGYNKEWKQEANIGKVNNQNFVLIPHARLVLMLTYKCRLEGINVVIQEESYTSKCSFYDNESIKKHKKYKGKRIKRGLFRTLKGLIINADINGALNIMKKAVSNAFDGYEILVCSMPIAISL